MSVKFENDKEKIRQSYNLIRNNKLLRYFYAQNYLFFKKEMENIPNGNILELGSGAGFIKEYIPECTTSDILDTNLVDLTVDALNLPFEREDIAAICMINVFHHIQDVEQFLYQSKNVLKKGGKLMMVEPANTRWARFIYKNFHHEPFKTDIGSLNLPSGSPLNVANGALPWLVFKRDWDKIKRKIGYDFELKKMEIVYPLLYLLSGGLKWPQMVPKSLGLLLDRMAPSGMFYKIVLQKQF